MTMRLEGKAVAVTGGETGIGRAIALRCATEGAGVTVAGIQLDKLDEVVALSDNLPGTVLAVPTDVTDDAQIDAMIERTVDEFGRLDAAVANAGAFNAQTPFIETDIADWHRVIAVNLTGVFVTLQAAARVLVRQGEGGSLLATGSSTAIRPIPGLMPYVSSKGGVHQMMRALAIELAEQRIRCNTVVPGVTNTPAVANAGADYAERGLRYVPMGEMVEADELAALVAFALSDEAPHMTGTLLKVDAGRTSA